MDVIVWIPKTRAGGKLYWRCQRRKREMTTLPVMEKTVSVQTFQDVMCKPSAQPRYVAVFTVLRFLHLCLSDSVRVKSLQASVLRRNAAARVRHRHCFSVSSDRVSALLVMLESICKHFLLASPPPPPKKRDSSFLH